MPQIRDYTAAVDQLRPTETGVEALAMEGRRIGAFSDQAANTIRQSAADQARAAEGVAAGAETEARAFSGVAKSVAEAGDQAGQYVTHQEISHGAASFAQLHSDLTDAWNNTAKNADPNDTSIAGKFRETALEPAIDQFVSSFSTTQGQQWAQNHADALRDHMFEKQTADMTTLAGDAVGVNVRKMTNAWTNTARSDPSSVPFLLRTADSSVAGVVGTSPNLKGVDAAHIHSQVTQKAKEDIVRAGALGAIEKSSDPEAAAAAFAKRYPDYVNAQEIDQFAKFAKANQRAGQLDAERAARLQKEQAIDKSAQLRDEKYVPDLTSDNPKFTNKQILNDHSLTWEDRQRLLGVINKADKVDVDDPEIKATIGTSMHDPNVPLSDIRSTILEMQSDGKLTAQTANTMRQLSTEIESGPIKEPIYGKTMVDAAKQIGTDEVGKEHFANFQLDFMSQYLAAKRAGTAPTNALDTSDPKSMISQAMKPYMRDAMTRARDRALKGINPDDFEPGRPPTAKPAAAAAGEPAGVPAAKDREVGKAYPTPMGLMRWTGTGWVRI